MKVLIGAALLVMSFNCISQTNSKSGQVRFKLFEVFIKGDTLCFETSLFNQSQLGYTPLYIQFFIRDRHTVTRTAVQEKELSPLIPFQMQTVAAKSSMDLLFLFKQFTIPWTKELVLVIRERDGSRDMALHVSGRRLLRMIRSKT